MREATIRHLPHNPRLRGMARLIPDVVFSTAGGEELRLQLLRPWEGEAQPGSRRFPLIVFLQGSAWTKPDFCYELPQLARYARAGYVAATITHRNYQEGYPAPAFLQDAKTAVRFLRAHAAEYSIDPDRVCFFGTSSGGNTAMLMALTGDDARYRTGEYAEFSDAVQLCIECFGPSDLEPLLATHAEENGMISKFLGGDPAQHLDLLHDMSPLRVFEKTGECAPMLLIHGDADELVPYSDGEKMFRALLAEGIDAEMICVDGAPHEGSFWSEALHDAILDFLMRRL